MTQTQNTQPPATAGAWHGDHAHELLQVDRIGPDHFLARHSQPNRAGGLFGGQIVGQGLMAALQTAPEKRRPSEVRIVFLLAGAGLTPIEYKVDTLMEGGSFSVRRVRVEQADRLIAELQVSFHKVEQGYEHSDSLDVMLPPPEELLSLETLAEKFRDRINPAAFSNLTRLKPVELRPVNPDDFLLRIADQPECWYWMRARAPLPAEPGIHSAVLGYMSDWWFSTCGVMSHVECNVSPTLFATSLNHTLWLHRPVRADEWLLFHARSPVAAGARSLCLGDIWSRDGLRVASMAQEALFRPRLASHPDPTSQRN